MRAGKDLFDSLKTGAQKGWTARGEALAERAGQAARKSENKTLRREGNSTDLIETFARQTEDAPAPTLLEDLVPAGEMSVKAPDAPAPTADLLGARGAAIEDLLPTLARTGREVDGEALLQARARGASSTTQ